MLSKIEFIDALGAIATQLDEDRRLSAAMSEIISADCGKVWFDTRFALPGLLKLLSTVMQDTSGWLEYWLYELDCGKKYRKDSVKDAKGKPIKMQTIADVYALLKSEYKEK